MPKRPKQHVIDEQAQRIFKDSLPPAWVVNPFTTDYAKDFFVEVVSASEDVTGNVFVVQLKGKLAAKQNKSARSFTVPIKREHLSYYFQQLPLPVFVVAVDVNARQAYYEFAQRLIEQNQKLTTGNPNGRASFPMIATKLLSRTDEFLKELKVAWEFMRDRNPGSVVAAIDFRRKVLEQKDPRFKYEITLRDGHEHITVHAKEPVQFKLRVQGKGKNSARKLDAFLQEGLPLEAGDGVSIEVEGLPAVGKSLAKAVLQTPERPIEVRLFVQSDQGQRVISPEFRGSLTGGLKVQRFKGELPGCPMSFDLTIDNEVNKTGPVKVGLKWNWNMGAYDGQMIVAIPWLDQMREFMSAIAKFKSQMGTTISFQGNTVFEMTGDAHLDEDALSDSLWYLDFLTKARHICRALNLQVVVPAGWSRQDLADVEELYALTTMGEYTFPGRHDFETIGARLPAEQRHRLQTEKGKITFALTDSNYNFVNTSFPFSDAFSEHSDWENVSFEDIVDEGELRMRAKFSSCKVKHIWPRFNPNK